MISRLFRRLAAWQMANRPLVLLVVLALTGGALVLLQDLRFDFRPEALQQFSEEEQAFADAFEDRFQVNNNLLLVLLQGREDGSVLDRRGLSLLYRVTEQVESNEISSRVISLANLPRKDAAAGLLAFALGRLPSLVESATVDDEAVQRVRTQLAGSRMIPGQLVSLDGTTTAVVVQLAPGFEDHTVLDKPLAGLRRELETLLAAEAAEAEAANGGAAGYRFHFAGLPFVRVETVRNLKSEQKIFWPVTAALYLALLFFIYRDPGLTVLPLAAVGLASLWSLAVLPLTGTPVNVLNNIVPSLILVIGVCNAVHMLHGYRAARWQGADGPSAARQMMEELGLPAFLTTFTTAIGFLSLLVAHNESLQRLGWQAGAGILLSYLALVIVCPTVVAWFGGRLRPQAGGEGGEAADGLEAIVEILIRRPWASLALAIGVFFLCLAAGSRVEIDADLVDTFPPGHPIYESNRVVEQELGGVQPLEAQLEGSPGLFTRAEALRQVWEVQQRIAEEPEVLKIRSVIDLIAEVHGVLDDDQVAEVLTEEKIEHALGILRRFQRGGLRQFLSEDAARVRLAARLRAGGIRASLATIESIEARRGPWLEGFEEPVTLRLTGNAYISARGLDFFIRDLSFSLLTASVVIFLVLMVVFRSVRMGLLGVLPTLLPLAITLALIPVYGYQLNTSTAIVFTITIGMAVDNTIHLLTRFRTLRSEGVTLEGAIRATFRQTGRAVVASNLMLMAGFSILFLSDFEPIFRVAALTSTTIGASMIAAIFVLPELLALFGGPIGPPSLASDRALQVD